MNIPRQANQIGFCTKVIAVAAVLLWLLPVMAYNFEAKRILEKVPQRVSVTARADKRFLLSADYYAGAKQAAGVIVLHDCDTDRRRYSALAQRLAQQNLHTLAIDLRGYGDSVSPAFSRAMIKKNAIDIIDYQVAMSRLTRYWPDDLLAAYQFLRGHVGKNKGIAIVASGCSAGYAVALAEKIRLKAMVLITPKMSYSEQERYKNLIDIPSYFISSANHLASYQMTQELFAWNGSKQSKIQIFKGDRYDYQLVSGKKQLVTDIAHWLHFNLNF